MYVEYKRKDRDYWISFGKRFNPGRNYYIFGLLSQGVRVGLQNGLPSKGLPDNLGCHSRNDNILMIEDGDNNRNTCTLEQAKNWGVEIKYVDGKPTWANHPDWHSHTWLTLQEFENQLLFYKNHPDVMPGDAIEYFAILSACKEIESAGYDVRIVLWFDN